VPAGLGRKNEPAAAHGRRLLPEKEPVPGAVPGFLPSAEAGASAQAASSVREARGFFAPRATVPTPRGRDPMANSPARDRTAWTRRRLTHAGRIGAGAAAALALTLGVLAVHLATRRGQAPTLYVALGDSYTAGDGIPAQLDGPAGCERSSHSYPVLVARQLSLKASQYRDVSCSSAKVANLTAPQHAGGATIPPQLRVLSANATLVTVGIGGNDLGFTGILTRCVELDAPGVLLAQVLHRIDDRAPCRAFYTSGGADQIGQKIQAASAGVAAALRRIHDRAPRARVLVVGYPDLLPASNGSACALVLGITAMDVGYLNNVELQVNRMLSRQAAAAGDGYVDTYTPSVGHDACAASSVRWIEPLLPSAPAAPMHPNAAGQRGMATAVEHAIGTAG
jgi:lysophospholipase L1-like esterase